MGLRSLDVLQQLPRPSDQRLNLFPLFNRALREKTVLERILVLFRRARTRCAPMHSTTLLAGHRRRAARLAGAGPGPAARAGKHWAGIARVIVAHRLLGRDLRSTGTGSAAA